MNFALAILRCRTAEAGSIQPFGSDDSIMAGAVGTGSSGGQALKLNNRPSRMAVAIFDGTVNRPDIVLACQRVDAECERQRSSRVLQIHRNVQLPDA